MEVGDLVASTEGRVEKIDQGAVLVDLNGILRERVNDGHVMPVIEGLRAGSVSLEVFRRGLEETHGPRRQWWTLIVLLITMALWSLVLLGVE